MTLSIRLKHIAPIVLLSCALMGQAADTPGDAEAAPVPPSVSDGASQLVHGDVAKAIATYTDALRDTGLANDRRATILNDRGVAIARSGQTKLALEDYNRAVELFPEYPVAYNNRGNLLLALGQLGEAVKDFDRAVLLAPGYAAAYSNRGNANMKLGHTAEALADFSKAIELMPASAPPLSGRGIAYLSVGKPHSAIRDFSRAVSADTRFASAYRNRAEARMTIGQRDEAIEDLSRAVAFDVNNQELYVVRGYAYLLAGNTASALKDFSHAIELDPKSSAAFEGRGLANGRAEAPDDAYADLNRAIELDPRSPVAYAFRAVVYKQNGQPDIGSKDVETAIKLDPKSPEALWAEGEIAEASGQADVAITNLRRVLETKPGWQFAADALKRLGAPTDDGESKPQPDLDIAKWHVYVRGKDYFAVADDYPLIRVPLEMIGEGAPKLLEWEIKAAPYSGYGILRFSGGRVAVKNGFEETELAAIIDINGNKVLAIQPNRQGDRIATWTWEGDHLQVASVDGVTDEYQLRRVAVATANSAPSQRRYDSAASERQRRYAKPKTIFDLLFGN
ncbi:tetratricopeptide repeat protein [Hyphomicrobium methylovorum]|uniref:tetratricopeptide repeat protein n=1 Tax=Hyphomicrobium methylovorum TaxID=84 RepID=UPI001FEBB4DD|nr:tetratricopeptide repeat protein [Hyphomicrobium methylovorum]